MIVWTLDQPARAITKFASAPRPARAGTSVGARSHARQRPHNRRHRQDSGFGDATGGISDVADPRL
jgi:hypothetical protein